MKWGVVHDGTAMYIIRIERKSGRPFIVASGAITVGKKDAATPLALICYMILSGRDDVSVIDPTVVAQIPEPRKAKETTSWREYQFSDSEDDDGQEDNDYFGKGNQIGSSSGFTIEVESETFTLPLAGTDEHL